MWPKLACRIFSDSNCIISLLSNKLLRAVVFNFGCTLESSVKFFFYEMLLFGAYNPVTDIL